MRILCDQCQTEYVISNGKLDPRQGFSCPKCGHVIRPATENAANDAAVNQLSKWQSGSQTSAPRSSGESPSWYYSYNGESSGPFTESDLITKFKSASMSEIAPMCYVWCRQFKDVWKPVMEVEPFASAILMPPPPAETRLSSAPRERVASIKASPTRGLSDLKKDLKTTHSLSTLTASKQLKTAQSNDDDEEDQTRVGVLSPFTAFQPLLSDTTPEKSKSLPKLDTVAKKDAKPAAITPVGASSHSDLKTSGLQPFSGQKKSIVFPKPFANPVDSAESKVKTQVAAFPEPLLDFKEDIGDIINGVLDDENEAQRRASNDISGRSPATPSRSLSPIDISLHLSHNAPKSDNASLAAPKTAPAAIHSFGAAPKTAPAVINLFGAEPKTPSAAINPFASSKPTTDESSAAQPSSSDASVDKPTDKAHSVPEISLDSESSSEVQSVPDISLDDASSEVQSVPEISLDDASSEVQSVPDISLDDESSSVQSVPDISLDDESSSVQSVPDISLDDESSAVQSVPDISLDDESSSVQSVPDISLDDESSSVQSVPNISLDDESSSVQAVPDISLDDESSSAVQSVPDIAIDDEENETNADESTPDVLSLAALALGSTTTSADHAATDAAPLPDTAPSDNADVGILDSSAFNDLFADSPSTQTANINHDDVEERRRALFEEITAATPPEDEATPDMSEASQLINLAHFTELKKENDRKSMKKVAKYVAVAILILAIGALSAIYISNRNHDSAPVVTGASQKDLFTTEGRVITEEEFARMIPEDDFEIIEIPSPRQKTRRPRTEQAGGNEAAMDALYGNAQQDKAQNEAAMDALYGNAQQDKAQNDALPEQPAAAAPIKRTDGRATVVFRNNNESFGNTDAVKGSKYQNAATPSDRDRFTIGLRSVSKTIQECYKREAKTGNMTPEKLYVSFSLNPSGNVDSFAIEQNVPETFNKCLNTKKDRWKFPPFDAEKNIQFRQGFILD